MRIEHIVIFSRSLPMHSIGGMEIIAWDLARAFKKRGFKVTCITTKLDNYLEKFTKDGIEIIVLKNTTSGKYTKKWFEVSTKYFLDNFSQEKNIAVLSVSAAAAGLIKQKDKIAHIPIVFQAHGTSIEEIKSKLRTLKLKAIVSSLLNAYWFIKDMNFYPKADAIVAVGDKVYEDLTTFPNSLFLDKSKIYLIQNGIDTEIFKFNQQIRDSLRRKFNIKESTKVIISASRLHRQKGIHIGLKAFAKYLQTNSNSLYIIIGDGPERKSLEDLAKKLNIEDKVIFLGALAREELAKYLNIGDIFLFTTTHTEGLPLNALEALAMGLKIVISSHLQGVIKINKEAVLPVDIKDIDSIAKALELKANSKRNSLLPVEYTLDYCANRYIELFNRIKKKNV